MNCPQELLLASWGGSVLAVRCKKPFLGFQTEGSAHVLFSLISTLLFFVCLLAWDLGV